MKSSLGISNFLEEIVSLSRSLFFLTSLHWTLRKAFLSLLNILWNSAFKWVYPSFSTLHFTSFHSYLTHASAGDSWTLKGKSESVSCGVTSPFSWVLVSTRFCLCPQSLFPQSCVSSGGSMAGLLATSSKRAYTIPRSTAPRAPAPAKSTADLHMSCSNNSITVSVGSLCPGAHNVCLSPLNISGRYGLWF